MELLRIEIFKEPDEKAADRMEAEMRRDEAEANRADWVARIRVQPPFLPKRGRMAAIVFAVRFEERRQSRLRAAVESREEVTVDGG